MAVKKINETTLAAIGNAIRTVLGVDTTYKPSQMAAAINSIRSKLGSKSITSNGTYTAASQDLMGFSQVVVNVGNSFDVSDEGKVVSNGALVEQTARATDITVNGTYDTTLNDEVTVDVAGVTPTGNINITDLQSTDVTNYATAQVVDADLVAGNIKKDVDILGVVGTYEAGGITPTGNINITDMQSTDVTNYATAQVVDSDLVAGNIKKDVNILGVIGTYEGSGGSDRFLKYDWDFKESLVDSISGVTASLTSATQTSDGVLIASSSGRITIPSTYKLLASEWMPVTIEVDIGAMTAAVSDDHLRFLMVTDNYGFIYRSNGYWSLYNGQWASDSDISDFDYFANSTLKVEIDSSNYWHIYKDGVLVYEPSRALSIGYSNTYFIGSNAKSCNSVVIEGLRIELT